MVAALALATSACAGPGVLIAGETVRGPGPDLPSLRVQVLASDTADPVTDAVIEFDGDPRRVDDTGSAVVEWFEREVTVRAEAPGFEPKRVDVIQLPESELVEVSLTPIVLTGTVVSPTGAPVQGAEVGLNGQTAITGPDGRFELARAQEGTVLVRRAAWEPVSREWEGRTLVENFTLEPRMIRALRVNNDSAGKPAVWAEFLAMAEQSDVNALVIDTKDEAGEVPYDTPVQKAHDIGAVTVRFDVRQLLADMEDAGLYAITRVVTFQDDPMARAHPEWAARDTATGGVWENNKGLGWMDPTDRSAWEYPLELGIEACKLGFDEIQYDYVRFPSDGPIDRLAFDGPYTEENRVATIAAFLTEARSRLNPLGCAVAADIFAITVSSLDDQGIGQRPEELSQAVDVLSPMIYPTHYGNGWLGLDEPNDHPDLVIGGALDDGLPRMQGSAILRPWLQTSTYGPTEVQIEVDEAEQRGLGWMLWQSINIFDPRTLRNDATASTPEAANEG